MTDGNPNECSHCEKLIAAGSECWMLTTTEITADNLPYHPSYFDLDYPFALLCSPECLLEYVKINAPITIAQLEKERDKK